MWEYKGNDISMSEGAYGIALEFTIKLEGATFTANDNIEFLLKSEMNGTTLLDKALTAVNLTQGKFTLTLTQSESEALTVGTYVYCLKWYQDGVFRDYLIESAIFKVVDVA